jgi:polyhydroxybutyrate depolymerase
MKKLMIPIFALTGLMGCDEYLEYYDKDGYDKDEYDKDEYDKDEYDKDGYEDSSENDQLMESLEHDGLQRQYIVYVPASYDGSSDVPLMLNFHGFGGTASDFMNWADMRDLAESENFILVYPQGALLEGSPHWNAALDSPDNKSSTDDFGFVEALIEELSSQYSIDTDRVYAAGYSNGAFFSYALACHRSDLVAAIGSVAGTMLEDSCNPTHPTSMINIHGTSDYVVPYTGGEGLAAIEDVLDYWVDFNNTNSSPIIDSVQDSGTRIERYSFINGDGNTEVEHYKVINGDHIWFDISYEGANTGQLIWDFVSRYDKNGLRSSSE